MVKSDLFADAQYLGPDRGSEPELILDIANDAPTFAQATATPVETKSFRVTRTYTIPPPPDMELLKKGRKKKVLRNGLIGGTVGLLTCGPLGAILIGVGTAQITKHACKKTERQARLLHETKAAQQAAAAVSMERHEVYPRHELPNDTIQDAQPSQGCTNHRTQSGGPPTTTRGLTVRIDQPSAASRLEGNTPSIETQIY